MLAYVGLQRQVQAPGALGLQGRVAGPVGRLGRLPPQALRLWQGVVGSSRGRTFNCAGGSQPRDRLSVSAWLPSSPGIQVTLRLGASSRNWAF